MPKYNRDSFIQGKRMQYKTDSASRQILNRQTFKALPACELIYLTLLVGRLYAGSALNV